MSKDIAEDLRLPPGYNTWVFAGSNLGLAYKDKLAAITTRESARAVNEQAVIASGTNHPNEDAAVLMFQPSMSCSAPK